MTSCRNLAYNFWVGVCLVFATSFAQARHGYEGIQKMPDDRFFPNFMAKKIPHHKDRPEKPSSSLWEPYDFSQLEGYLSNYGDALSGLGQTFGAEEHNRVKRRVKKRRSKSKRSRHHRTTATPGAVRNGPTEFPKRHPKGARNASTEVPIGRAGKETYQAQDDDLAFIEVPKDLYQTHLRPGVILRIHLSEAIIKMQYRNYAEHKDESVIEADVEYLRLTRKLMMDEILKFLEFRKMMGWFVNRTGLITEHSCNTNYLTRGRPPTWFTDTEEDMKRSCLFEGVYVEQVPYVAGEDRSLMAAVAPPVLHCDAATCTSVPFVDSMMFEEKLPLSNVRTVTRCQASCRARCKNDADCLKRCAERCLQA